MAKTTLKIYPATQGGIGDYHSNFDTAMFFKWMKSLLLTWSDHMKELHLRWLAGEFSEEKRGFYDFEKDRPLRDMILSMDNAPYHKGIYVLLSGKSKGEIADILRQANISEITYKDRNDNEFHIQVLLLLLLLLKIVYK